MEPVQDLPGRDASLSCVGRLALAAPGRYCFAASPGARQALSSPRVRIAFNAVLM
jgi:hypothetical protein